MNLLRTSRFAGSPRGDNLYSYRFSEILSAGAIPVVFADGWIMPYTSDVVDWNDVAILLPQGEVNRTVDVMTSYSNDRMCEMHIKVFAILRLICERFARETPWDTKSFGRENETCSQF